jgi:hypothetical protein
MRRDAFLSLIIILSLIVFIFWLIEESYEDDKEYERVHPTEYLNEAIGLKGV